MRKKLSSQYYKIETPEGFLHTHIDYDKDFKIHNVFLRIPPVGTTISGLTMALGIALSKYFRLGGTVDDIVKDLRSIKSSKKVFIDQDTYIENIMQAVAMVLLDFDKNVKKS